MATNYTQLAGKTRFAKSKVRTPQTQPIKGREDEMVRNNAGGYSFKTEDWAQLDRFLILSSTGNTYYQGQEALVVENTGLVERLLAEDGKRVVDAAATVLRESRAMKTDAAFFVLALAASYKDDEVRAYALAALPSTVRIPTHLFTFVGYVNDLRGWGRALRRAVAAYYTDTSVSKLAMHAWKYKSRGGWSHRDVLRLSHADVDDPARNAVLRYMARGDIPEGFADDKALEQIAAANELASVTDGKSAAKLIKDYRLTREAVPTNLLNDPVVWEALLEDMPVQAMVRNLGKMANIGMTGPISDAEKKIVEALTNAEAVGRSRIHPMNVLIALKTYEKGAGVRGNLTWNANRNILDALDETFELAFGNVEPTGKRILVAGDDSGSMTSRWGGKTVADVLSPAEAAAAMMLITYRVEPNAVMLRYSTDYAEVAVSRRMTVNSLLKEFGRGGGTNTALPVHYALDKNIDFDAIVSYTDNETWAGGYRGYGYGRNRSGHTVEVLRDYQNKVGHPVRMANVAMVLNSVSDVDPTNPNMFEIAGMDSSTPKIISEFVSGRI